MGIWLAREFIFLARLVVVLTISIGGVCFAGGVLLLLIAPEMVHPMVLIDGFFVCACGVTVTFPVSWADHWLESKAEVVQPRGFEVVMKDDSQHP